ncbi:MAG: DUF4190 domain-containing protein [Actinomycetia bacterium]|nr:DUF4190 domain-containing protein [Actinomycetes bacterium]
MDNKNNQKKYSKLSITSLVTGILTYICILPLYYLFEQNVFDEITGYIVYYLFLLGLAIAAIVCGIVDIKRIMRGQRSSKGKGFDIAGIALGSVFIFVFVYLFMIDLVDKINGEGEPLY